MNEKHITLKTKALRYFLLFLAAMLIMTFASRAIYAYQLPRVSITNMKNTTLNYQIESSGTVQTTKELPLIATPKLRVAEVCVKSGDVVEEDDVLMKYDTVYLEDYIEKLSRQIEIDTLTRSDYYTAQAWNSAKILTFQIEDNQKKIESYQQFLDNGAVMLSQTDGVITDVKVKAGDFTEETASFMIADRSQNLYFSGEITKEESKLIAAGDLVNISFRNGSVRLEDCEIKSVTAADKDDIYNVEIPLNTAEVTIGEIGQMSVKVVSEERYDCIPLEAIHKNGDQHYIYLVEESEGFLGTEYNISVRNVVVMEQNESYAAVQDSGLASEDLIVTYSNKELYEGQIVRMG
ncbi:MAG: hypothetical protein ACI4I9_07330 [Porcipelethomonas sp.]